MIRAADRIVELKVHRVLWSGRHPENALEGLRECYEARVGRAEIDFQWWRGELVVAHDEPHADERPPTLAEFLEVVRAAPPGPTLLMLDAKDKDPWPDEVVERLVGLIEPVRERVYLGTPADWNLRKVRAADPRIALTFDPMYYVNERERGSAGRWRAQLETLLGLVPGIRELHLRLSLVERMRADGCDAAEVVHAAGVAMDTWTLNAGSERWRERLAFAVESGTDIVSTDTARDLAAAMR